MVKNKKLFVTMFIIIAAMFDIYRADASGIIDEIKERGTLRLSTNAEFEPFEYKDGNDIVGIDIEIAREIATRMGVELEVTDVSFDALTLELQNRTCDIVLAGLSYSEDKAKNVDFSDSYFGAKQSIIVSKTSDIIDESGLSGKRVGVQLGTTGDIYCTENIQDVEIHRYNKGSEAVLDLASNRLDAVVLDDLPAKKLANKNGDSVKVLDEYLFEENYRVAVPKGETELLATINEIISDMRESGKIEEIVKTYTENRAEEGMGFTQQIYNNLIYKDRYMYIVQGLITTIEITCASLVLGLAIGIGIALIKLEQPKKRWKKLLVFMADVYLAIIRGTPVVVQLFVIYYLILGSTGLDKVIVAMISFGINSGAYVSETIRSGILSINVGQIEAGRSLGLSKRVTMTKIVFPQALKNILPTLANEFISLIKETSVAGFIGVMDLSKAGDIIRSQTYEPFVPLITVAIIYLIIVLGISTIMSKFEGRLRSGDKR